MSNSIEIELYTKRKLSIRELNGLEEQNIDDMIPAEKFMSQPTFRAIASITAIDGEQLARPTGLVDLKERMSRLSGGEKDHLLRIYRKRFGAPLDADELGNVSAPVELEPASVS